MSLLDRAPSDTTRNNSAPLRPIDLHILLTLTAESCHGYGIVKAIEERTDGHISLVPGNLYPVLKRMTVAGLIRPCKGKAASGTGLKERRYYEITASGQEAARSEAHRLRALVEGPALQSLLLEEAPGTT